MKKIFAVILSLVILALSAVPSSDQEDMLTQQTQTMALSVEQSPGSIFDVCNPFFFCHTGHSAFVQSEVSFMEFTSTPVRLVSENPVFVDIPVYTLVWHPPKG
ncbi:MAG: hypothetical protein IEMM0006_1982 [bacterium]|nr:MAG: hypothetical protein IEMM0006_1982 [bacterium]